MGSTSIVRAAALLFIAACGACSSTHSATAVDAPEALDDTPAPNHLRYLAINIGNVALGCTAYENKLCTPDVSDRVRAYIAEWRPDVIMMSEVLDEPQLVRTLYDADVKRNGNPRKNLGGPILPPELSYQHFCHSNVNRNTGLADDDFVLSQPDGSHRHECVIWDATKFQLLTEAHAFGANDDDFDRSKCHYDFTAQATDLKWLGGPDENGDDIVITAVAVHPQSNPRSADAKKCRMKDIASYWQLTQDKARVIIGGDWNTENDDELQVADGFSLNYSRGRHWTLAAHDHEWSAQYLWPLGKWQYDHTYSNFGAPCTDCGQYYGGAQQDLAFGSALGEYDGHPWAAHPGLDHRQVLVDMTF